MTIEHSAQTMAPPVMRAWFAVSESEENLDAVNRHYGVAPSGLPPTRMLVEWREAGHPDPSSWIPDKVRAIVEEEAA